MHMKKFLFSVVALALCLGVVFALQAEEKDILGVTTPVVLCNNGDDDVTITVDGLEYDTLEPGEIVVLIGLQPTYHEDLTFDHYTIFADDGPRPIKADEYVSHDTEIVSAYLKN